MVSGQLRWVKCFARKSPSGSRYRRKYQEPRHHWYGEGTLFTRQLCTGLEFGDKNLYEIREGDLVYNRICMERFDRVATKENTVLYVSTSFPTFRVNQERADAPFLVVVSFTRDGLGQTQAKFAPGYGADKPKSA